MNLTVGSFNMRKTQSWHHTCFHTAGFLTNPTGLQMFLLDHDVRSATLSISSPFLYPNIKAITSFSIEI